VIRITINSSHLRVFRKCQLKVRRDWLAVFSTNEYGEVWPYVTRGLTPTYDRLELERKIPKIGEISKAYLQYRPEGGRFFINQCGAYLHQAEFGPYDQFVEFLIVDVASQKDRE
jgi:hypothetical protein